jgi:predicted nucleotide-binding protein (sugar kinase/HSP70/actin superfamily)
MKEPKLKTAKNGRIIFTKAMKKNYTLLFPMMAPIHFVMLQQVFNHYGYHAELLTDTSPEIAQTGLKFIQNDMCYPAILSCGQMIHALQSGKYDMHHVALMISQTGGGCRASNYISLLRKGLKRAGMDYVPTISVNMSHLEPNPGMKLTLPMIRRMAAAVIYGDMLMVLKNQAEPYEIRKGETAEKVTKWQDKLCQQMLYENGYKTKVIRQNLNAIAQDFDTIPSDHKPRVKVGIVGEIYVKYSALGNNCLEDFLREQDCEVNLPGMMNFVIFKVDNRIEDAKLYGGQWLKKFICERLYDFCASMQKDFNDAIAKTHFQVPSPYEHVKELVKGINGYGNKMGEGWLLTGEMLELADSGYENIICTQPFGCLPNHISGKGMIRCVREANPKANIVAVDYDAGAPRVNQENRIKLMLSIGKENLEKSLNSQNENVASNSLTK